MCELYLHTAKAPTSRHPWLAEFIAHARVPFDNPNGWGLAFYEGSDAQLFHEPISAANSELAQWVLAHPPKTDLVIGHLRKASEGGISLANTQPLSRMVNGRRTLFAHNGSVAALRDTEEGQRLERECLGTADSEVALLKFLHWLGERCLRDAAKGFSDFAHEMAEIGPFNAIITDGTDTLIHSDRRKHASDGEDAEFRGPGLYRHYGADGSLIVTSEPMAEGAVAIPEGTSLHLRDCEVVEAFGPLENAA